MQGFVLSNDLLFSSQLVTAARTRNWSLQVTADVDELLSKVEQADRSIVLLDLSVPGLDIVDVVQQLRGLESSADAIVAFGPHVHQSKLDSATAAGCDRVLTRGQLHRTTAQLLEEYFAT